MARAARVKLRGTGARRAGWMQLQWVGADRTLQVFDIRLVGVNLHNLERLGFTVVALGVVWAIGQVLRFFFRLGLRERTDVHARFVSQQIVQILTGILLLVAVASIWFTNPTQLGQAAAFIGAGLAIALQRVITAIAGYFVILRGGLFDVGDRITLGGVRGDVVSLGWLRTTVMEMGQPPEVQSASPAMWVEGRQYTGRIVTITNDKVFDKPVYNYTREFPYLWDEMHLPITYQADRKRAEQILLDAARRHAVRREQLSGEDVQELKRRYFLEDLDLQPHVFVRLTDNWLELALRFLAPTHGVRALKDRMSREIIDALDAAGIGVASGTYAVVEMPRLKVEVEAS